MRIRERKKGAKPQDFDQIGTEFHRWVRQHADEQGEDRLVLKKDDDFYDFITVDFDFYSRCYMYIAALSEVYTPEVPGPFYNDWIGFTLQDMVMLSPLKPSDGQGEIDTKIRLVSTYIDILLARRIWNFRSISYSTMQYALFLVMREIRGMDALPLAKALYSALDKESELFSSNDRLRLHQMNRYQIHHLLARITHYVDRESHVDSMYEEYVKTSGKNRYEIEHVWANKPERHKEDFPHPADFDEFRNRLGALVLMPKKINDSLGDKTFKQKSPHYHKGNLLAASLNQSAYEHNPGYLQFVKRSGFAFQPYEEFTATAVEERQHLYRQIAERIWDPDQLLREVGLEPS